MLTLRHDRSAEGIVTLRLAQPHRPVVVLDKWLLEQLHLFFDWLGTQPRPTGFVLMSENPRTFVAGADLAEIDALDDASLHAYLTEGAQAFARISRLECPSVACVHRTALGGGLELAMHCDALIAQRAPEGEKPWRVGLPEAGLGLCPGWGGTQMLPARIDPAIAIRATALGTTWSLDEAPAGLFDEILPSGADLHAAAVRSLKANSGAGAPNLPRAIDASNALEIGTALRAVRGTLPATPAVNAVLEAVEIGIAEGWTAAIAAERRLLVGLRHTPQAREKLDAFLKKDGSGKAATPAAGPVGTSRPG